ncbi:hypothetical protein E5S67_00705 [Microcoleus sp. IPMA8]|uniref:Uncharacterized protein n=1 Tax=Microcoleus asticus IPMA8 TaxID=2563858 RepID=A0ABX2CST1_9CYAN|nr:hypothetical protein [Microcoleus asticus IPMA8]
MIYNQLSRLDIVVYLRAIQTSRQKVNVSGSGFSVRNRSISARSQPRDSIKSSIQFVMVARSMYFAPRQTGQISGLRVPVPPHSGQSQWVVTGSGVVRMLFMLGKSTRGVAILQGIALLVNSSKNADRPDFFLPLH